MRLKFIKDDFLVRFTDGGRKFEHRRKIENASRPEGELLTNYFHTVKHTVVKGWPEDLTNVANANHSQEAIIQSRQREQKILILL